MRYRDLNVFSPAIVMPLAIGAGLGLGLVLGASAVALSPAAAAAVNAALSAVTTCSSTAACVGAVNTGSGPAIVGTSPHGTALKGVSVSSHGVEGSSTSSAGVLATSSSANALYAANDATRSTIDAHQAGSGPAISGTAVAGPGMNGTSTSGSGVNGTSPATFAAGVNGLAANGYGVRGTGGFGGYFVGTSFSGILASTSVTGYSGVVGADHSPDGGYGVYGASDRGTAGTFFQTHGNTQPALAVYGGTVAGIGSLLMDVRSSDDNGYFDVDDGGNLTLSGVLSTSGSCSTGCARSRVRSYAPRETEPSMEDVGKAHLVAGSAYVALDPAFANVVDPATDYSVLITPEGDSNGVYVAQRTLHGFTVRENHLGRSSVAFSYRIVAKPFGSNAPRLPMIALHARAAFAATRAGLSRLPR